MAPNLDTDSVKGSETKDFNVNDNQFLIIVIIVLLTVFVVVAIILVYFLWRRHTNEVAKRAVLRVEYQPNTDEVWIRPGRGEEGQPNTFSGGQTILLDKVTK